MPLNFGPPVIDFSPLGNLGKTYDEGVKRNREAAMNDARQKALAGFGQNSDLAALGQTLLRSGDLEGGMAALRLDSANKGTPWQKEQAAAEAARAGATLAETKREHDAAEERARRAEERTTRPERITGKDEFGDPKYGDRDPVTGEIKWDDGTTTPGRGSRVGPQSGGEGDPNLPAPTSQSAQLALSPQTSSDPGYVIPKTLQGFPPGTVLPPGGGPAPLAALAPPGAGAGTDTAIAAPAAAQAVPLAPPGATGPTAVAQAPTAPPPPAVGPGQPTVPGAPVTATQISQGTANIPPMSAKEMIDEAHRLGISPGQYRAARAEAIKKELEAKVEGGKAPTESQAASAAFANRMQGAEKEFRPVTESSTGFGDRLADVVTGGSGFLRNKLTSDKYQSSVAAKKEWIAALLRKDSGAAVSDQEFDYYNDVYFPKAGQSEVLVKQYERARERAYEGLRQGLTPGQIANLSKTAAGGGPALEPARGMPGEAGNAGSLTTKSGIKATW
jgi:hypothetical protein